MKYFALEDFPSELRVDSLYRLVNLAARRANQVNKPETRPLVSSYSRKPTIIALEEVLEGRVGYRTSEQEEDEYEVG